MKLSDRHGTAILTDCGNFTPNTNYAQGSNFCINCPGWRRFHEPYRTEEIARNLDNWRHMIHAMTSRVRTRDEWREAIQRVAHYDRWMVRHTADDLVHDFHRPSNRTPRVTDYPVEHHRGFPHLLLIGENRTETVDPLDSDTYLARDPRPGGIICAYIHKPDEPKYWTKLAPEQAAWARTFIDLGGEVYIWHPDDLPEIVHRLTGRHYTPPVIA